MRSILLAIALVACGREEPAKTTAAPAPARSIVGTWKTGCMPIAKAGWAMQAQLTADAAVQRVDVAIFSDPCVTMRSSETETRAYALGAGDAVDFTVQSLTRTYLNAADAADANAHDIFGYSAWKVGEARAIAGLAETPDQQPEHAVGAEVFQLAHVSGSSYTPGDSDGVDDGSTAALRPTALSKTIFIKQ